MNAEPTGPRTPLRHDAVTIPCPVCQTPFVAAGKRLYCSGACNAAAYRRRKRAAEPVVSPRARPRKPITVYECDACGTRAVGQQRCEECGAFMRRVGLGGACPHCDEAVAVSELLGQEVSR
jgi:hypothetical protein